MPSLDKTRSLRNLLFRGKITFFVLREGYPDDCGDVRKILVAGRTIIHNMRAVPWKARLTQQRWRDGNSLNMTTALIQAALYLRSKAKCCQVTLSFPGAFSPTLAYSLAIRRRFVCNCHLRPGSSTQSRAPSRVVPNLIAFLIRFQSVVAPWSLP